MKKYLTMDIGGTFIKYAIFDQDFREESARSQPTQKEPDLFLGQLLQIIKETEKEISGIAVSMGGFINPRTGSNTDYSVGDNFKKYNLKEKLKEETGFTVSVENDSNCAALAELKLGAGRDCRDFCLMTIGTGIGGAIIHDRQLLRGRNYKAGEFGFMLAGRRQTAGKASFYPACATSVLVKRVSAAVGRAIDGEYVFDHLEDSAVHEIYEEWLEDLAVAVGNVAVCFDPEKVLIGGGISARERFISDLRDRVYRMYRPLGQYTAVEACTLGNDAGKNGALINYLDQHGI
jgi:beta-glucoside kinase